jgi:caffeoyl-CoA O-methyltransferase
MTDKLTPMTPELYAYLVAHRSERDPVLAALARETEALGAVSLMQVAPEQGAFMTVLARAIGARAALEVGTFTGYSALCLARGLAAGGRLLACDVSEEWTAIARRHWEAAGVADKIELRLGPALETLRGLPREPRFDLAFVDADKSNYGNYYEEIVPRLRPNGLVLFDNVLWFGRVADPAATDPETCAIRELNDRVAGDPRVEAVMLPIADGLTIARKRAAGETA